MREIKREANEWLRGNDVVELSESDYNWLLSRVEALVEESKRAREAIRVASLFIRDKDVEHALVQPIEANVTLGEYLHKAMAALDAELRKAKE